MQIKNEKTRDSRGQESGRKLSWKDFVEEAAVNCFRFFGFASFEQVLDLDLRQYRLLCKAYRLKQIDEQLKIHELAYATMKASLRDKKGRLIYRKFNKFFDYEKALAKAEGELKEPDKPIDPRLSGYAQYLAKKKKEEEA